jgi:hypothetical protein
MKLQIWFEWGSATQSNGESLVKIQHCPATVNRWQLRRDRVRMPASIYIQFNLTYEVLGEHTTLFICLYHLR